MQLQSLLITAALLSTSFCARADTFSFDVAGGSSYSGSGSLTAVPDGRILGAYDVTSISGFIAGDPIVGLLPCAAYSVSNPCSSSNLTFDYDNVIYPTGQSAFYVNELDYEGLGIDLGSSHAVEISASGSRTDTLYFNGQPLDATPIKVNFSVAATPEPSSFFLLGTGLLGVVGMMRRRNFLGVGQP